MAGDVRMPGGPYQEDELAVYVGLDPGWYRDSANPSLARYWDGAKLSQEGRPLPTSVDRASDWSTHARSPITRRLVFPSGFDRETGNPSIPIKTGAIVCAVGMAAVVVAAVVTIGLGNGASAEASVTDAANTTLAGKTAHVSVRVTTSVRGESVTLSGTGSVNFADNSMQLEMPFESNGEQATLQEVFMGDILYESVPGISQVEPGKSWISVNFASLAKSSGDSSNDLLGNPSVMLRLLRHGGNKVSPLVPSVIDGVACQGYSVTIDKARIRSEIANAQLPGWLRQALSNTGLVSANVKIYIDGQGLLRRQTTVTEMALGGSAVAASGTVDFSNYGLPVSVSTPPIDQVVSLQKFLEDEEAEANPQ
jgi:Protein of unknown function (DUF2510)